MKKIELKLNANFKGIYEKIRLFFIKQSSRILILIGIIFLGYCAYTWYENIYSYQWDEVKKQDYMNNKNAGTNLNRARLEKVLQGLEKRKNEYEKSDEFTKDFFRLNGKQPEN